MFARSLALAALCGMSFAASAVTVDLRHEFIDGGKTDKTNADRVSVSHRFANGFGFSVEAKWKSGGDNTSQPYSDFVGNGHEESISWQWKANKNFSVTPGSILKVTIAAQSTSRICACNTASIMVSTLLPVIVMTTLATRRMQGKRMIKSTVAMRGPVTCSATGVPS